MDEINKLKAENERLKAENERLKEDYKKLYQQKDLDNARWQKRCTDLHIEDKAKTDKYWLVLQKIKAIVDARCNECEYGKDGITCKFGDCGEAKLHLISKLINKAEEE